MNTDRLLASAASAVTEFVDEKLGNEETEFSFVEAEKLSKDVGIHVSTIIRLGQEAGLSYSGRETVKRVRGFTTSSNDRWFGPGSSNSHGGSGWEQISGFAGQKG